MKRYLPGYGWLGLALLAGAGGWGLSLLHSSDFHQGRVAELSFSQGRIHLLRPAWGTGVQARSVHLEPLWSLTAIGVRNTHVEGLEVILPKPQEASRPSPSSDPSFPAALPELPIPWEKLSCFDCRLRGETPAGSLEVGGDFFLRRFPAALPDGPSRLELDALLEVLLPMGVALTGLTLRGEGEGARVRLHHLSAGVWGGEFAMEESHLDLASLEGSAALSFREIDIQEILRLFPVPELHVEARLQGQVGVKMGPEGWSIPPAQLAAAAPGVIRYTHASWQQVAQAAGLPEILPRVLANFHYTTLTLSLERPQQGEIRVRATMEGSNPDLYGGHPVQVNLDLSGPLDEILQQGLEARKLVSDRQKMESRGTTRR